MEEPAVDHRAGGDGREDKIGGGRVGSVASAIGFEVFRQGETLLLRNHANVLIALKRTDLEGRWSLPKLHLAVQGDGSRSGGRRIGGTHLKNDECDRACDDGKSL